jgi:isoleucyl-tRNA synthetase
MGASTELKATLNLPKTDFSMKANLPQNEPKTLARWEEMGIYERIREARQGAPIYLLHDGPPYANGPIHLGTAFNKTLKDFVVKSKTMAGYDSPYVPGWDCHGLPIEIKVDEALGRKKLEMAALDVRRACREYAEKYVELHRQQFKRLGIFGRWEQPYLTMSPEYESVIVATLYDFFEKGLIYRGLRPVLWCLKDKTALAEAEVEYEDHTSPSVWVKYALTSDPAKIDPALAGKKVNTIIWTTTPWTLPASMAVAFHPGLEYVALEKAGEVYVVAKLLAAHTRGVCKLEGAHAIAHFPGTRLEHATFAHPFLDRKILGVLADYVTTDQGTGAVHTAPSHGADDFHTGARYKLDQSCNVDESGRLRNGLPEYDGKTVFEANPHILELLKKRGALLAVEQITHSYPHCWRCHQPVIFRATEQWFISMNHPFGPTVSDTVSLDPDEARKLRARALFQIQNVKWDPPWGMARISNMLADRPEWCISRQRVWGVPIAVFYCEGCAQVLSSAEAKRAVVELFAREGADAWFRKQAAEILPAGTKCPKCGGPGFRKETDIVDVWFESGVSHLAVLGHEPGLPWPANLYLEGADQFRGWFQSSLLISIGAKYKPPYQAVVTPGWTLDEQGQAMSKSRGNDVDPVDIANRLGAEIVRLWVASVDFREDVVGSEALMQRVAEGYRKVRNTFRFILGNLNGFDPARDAVPFREMEPIDRYLLLRAAEVAGRARQWYEEFAFHKVYHQVHDFCIVDLSAFYFDILKDRLYTFAPRSRARRSAQTAVWRIGEALVRLLAPMMSFTTDEIWGSLPKVAGRPGSVHLALFPAEGELVESDIPASEREALRADWQTLLAVRDQALQAMEGARNAKTIGGSLEARVVLAASAPVRSVLERYQKDLCALLIVSQVALDPPLAGDGAASVRVQVRRAEGRKCERCWNYSTRVGEDMTYPTVCERCVAALSEIAGGK